MRKPSLVLDILWVVELQLIGAVLGVGSGLLLKKLILLVLGHLLVKAGILSVIVHVLQFNILLAVLVF